jgi:hypothetical protein
VTRRYGYLQEFFLGYFHPDWRLDAESRTDVVEDFLSAADQTLVRGVVNDLEELLGEPLDEEALHEKVLREYSLFHDPWQNGETIRGWLEGLLHEARRDLADGT